MKLPARLIINGFEWEVRESDSVSREGSAYGSCHCTTQTIYIDPTSTDQKKKQTLLHEILHAISWQSGLIKRLKDDKLEEEIISALSFGLYQVLSDNGLLSGFGENRT